MPDPRERFIELALRPLAGKSAAEDLARGELMERLNHSRPAPGDDSLETATAQLEASPALWRKTGKPAFLLLLAFTLVLGAVAWASWRDLVRIDVFYHVLPIDSTAEQELEATVAEDQRLFLFANSAMMGKALRDAWRKSCETTLPDDPAWLEEHAVDFGFNYRPVRERILEQARRIDPGNGLWDLREAGACLVRSKFRYFQSKPRTGGLGPALPMITTDEAFDRAVALIEKAASAPRLKTRIPPRTARRLEILGPATDLAELADRRTFAEEQRGTGIYIPRWVEFWEVRARELEKDQDREGLRQWFKTLERLQSRLLAESGDPRLYVPGYFVGSRGARGFQEVLSASGLAEESARLDHWTREYRDYIRTSSAASDPLFASVAQPDGGDWIYYAPLDLVPNSALEPGRRAEHAMADRMIAVAAALLFGLLAWLAGLEGWRRALPVRGLADGVGALLRPSDFAWIGVLGIVVPATWHVAIAGLSPLGWRDFTIALGDMKPVALRAAGSFLFATCMLVQSARWRLAKRGGVLGFRPSLWQGWVMAATAALFLPAVGAVRYLSKWLDECLNYGSAVAGLPLLWLLWRSFALILCPRRAALPGVLVCRMLVPCFVVTGLLLLAAVPLLKREESRWVQRDPLAHPDPEGSGTSVVEARLMKAQRSQLLHAIETAPPAK